MISREPEDMHAGEASYSPSKLDTYESCPRKYYFQYVLKIPQEGKTYFSLGSVVHSVVEHITRKLNEGIDVSEEEALEMLDEFWQPSAYVSRAEEAQDRDAAVKMVRDFLVHQAGKDSEIVGLERDVELDIEGRKVRGKVDRIDRSGDGLEVIDYKTSKKMTTRPKLEKDFQMALYKLAVEKALDEDVEQVGHWYLRMDREWTIEMTEDQAEEVKQRALDLIQKIEAGEFPPCPGYTCRRCDYERLCEGRGLKE